MGLLGTKITASPLVGQCWRVPGARPEGLHAPESSGATGQRPPSPPAAAGGSVTEQKRLFGRQAEVPPQAWGEEFATARCSWGQRDAPGDGSLEPAVLAARDGGRDLTQPLLSGWGKEPWCCPGRSGRAPRGQGQMRSPRSLDWPMPRLITEDKVQDTTCVNARQSSSTAWGCRWCPQRAGGKGHAQPSELPVQPSCTGHEAGTQQPGKQRPGAPSDLAGG